jgi:hypothetical protein
MTGRRFVALASVCGAFALAAQGATAGEITGNGTLKPVNGNSPCAYSGQEDLQWYEDNLDQVPRSDPVKGVPAHSQNWGHWPDREGTPNPGTSCNGHLNGMKP